MEYSLLLPLAAVLVGFSVGLTGVGGGALMTPILLIFFGIPAQIAVATDLLFAVITKLVAASVHQRQQSVDWNAAKRVWAGSIPGAILGVFAAVLLTDLYPRLLTLLLATLLFVSAASLVRGKPKTYADSPRGKIKAPTLGFAMGLAVSMTSIGAGALGAVLFTSLIGAKEIRKVIGTDIVHAIPVGLIAGFGYAAFGYLDLTLLGLLLIGSIPGAVAGSIVSGRINASAARYFLAGTLVLGAGLLISR